MEVKMKLKFTALLALVLILMLSLAACSTATDETMTNASIETAEDTSEPLSVASTTEAREPYIMEDFKLTALDGTETSLYAYEGKMIVVNFWATWCKYCVQEMPLLDELNKRDDVVVLAISVGEDQKTVQDYIDKYGYEFEVFLDEEGTLASKFGVTGFPTSLFLGKDFEYFYSFPGMLEENTIEGIFNAIDEVLQNRQ
jgi:thiol-disulfide isomerase/thioredoxin